MEIFQVSDLHRMIEDNIIRYLKVIPANINESILNKIQSTSLWTNTGHFRANFDLTLAQNAKFWNIAKTLQAYYFV